MSPEIMATIALWGVFIALMVIKVPVAFSLLISAVVSALLAGQGLSTIIQQMVKGIDSFTLLAIPFFIAMGEIMGEGGISEKIVDLANLLVGRFRGGLAYINCIDSMFFGGISGSAVADVSSLGSIVIPMMVKQGYDEDFAVGLTVVTACQGVLIPPSHNMVIYALAAGIGGQIADLLWGGMLPGILLGCLLMVFCFLMAKKYNFPRCAPVPKGQRLKIVLNAILPMMIFVIIMGGIAAGVFTATESAAVACVYTFLLVYSPTILFAMVLGGIVIGIFAVTGSIIIAVVCTILLLYILLRYTKLKSILRPSAKFTSLGRVLKNTLKTLAIVLTLIAAAKTFAYMMTVLRIPDAITSALIGLTNNRILLLLIINALLLFLGCFMDMAPLILIMTPILMPVITGPVIHMDLVQFGIMLIYNLAVGLCTPPVGSALFVGCAIAKTPIERTALKMLPMFGVMVLGLMLVTFIPQLSLWLPSVVVKH